MALRHRLAFVSSIILILGIIIGIAYSYLEYISNKIYEESTGHLIEIYSQVNNNFAYFIERNWGNLNDWNHHIHIEDEKGIKKYLDERQQYWGFTNFYFIADDGSCFSQNGETEKFSFGKSREALFENNENVFFHESIASGQTVTLFAIPVPKGSYKGFDYSAIAVSYNNADMVQSLKVDAFSNQSVCFVTDISGNVLLSSQEGGSVFKNYLSYLHAGSDISNETLDKLRNDWKNGDSGVVSCNIGGVDTYISYQSVGYQDTILLGIVPKSAASASLLQIQQATIDVLVKIFLLIFAVILVWLILRYQKQKKKSALEIRYREMMFDILTVSVNDIFLMLDAETFHVDYLSSNVERLLGISHDAVLKDIKILGQTTGTISFEELKNIPINESRTWEREHIHMGTGDRRWYNESVYHENIQGMEKIIVVMSDRTTEKKMNQRLQQALDAAKNANEAKSNFLSNMSHDIRTPMNAIIGFSTFLAKEPDNPEKVKEYTRKITSSSHHLLNLINDVLDMSKIESGKTSLNISEFSLPEILKELNTILLPQAKAKNQTFLIRAEGRPAEHLLGDKLHLNQIFINLLSNAIKYTQSGGKIEFIVQDITKKSSKYSHLRFIVRDNGFGMSKEFLKTIFEPFSREITDDTSKIQGTGLGMAITKNLVRIMGGTIDVESEPGKGSTFTVELSFAMPDCNDNNEFWQRHGISKILVADDDDMICQDISSIMTNAGVETVCASNGAEAVKAVVNAHESGKDFHAVLLDWKMPQMNGAEAVKTLREKINCNIPIIVLSSYDWSDIENEARSAGVDAFLPKPFFASAFKHIIEEIKPEIETESAENKVNENSLEGMMFLVAEDNELNAEILSELLAMENASYELAENGEIAFEMFQKSETDRYDMILMDVQMPKMNGYEATKAIRSCEHPRAKSIPIIAMTANAFAEDVANALAAGMTAHLSKPIDMEAVKSLICKLRNDKESVENKD